MKTTNRRNFLGKSAAAAAAATAVAAVPAKAQTTEAPTKRVIYRDGKKPAKPSARMSGTVAYGNLIFISGVGYHKEGDITGAYQGRARLHQSAAGKRRILDEQSIEVQCVPERPERFRGHEQGL